LVCPLDTRGGSTIITAISNGTIAHKKNHHIGLRPFLMAIMLPTMPAIASRITYLNNGILYFLRIIRLSFLYLTYADKRHCAACNLGEYPVPFLYGLEISLYLSKLYKIR